MHITNFATLHDAFSKYRSDNRWMFRGQARSEWLVIPKAGRTPYSAANDLVNLDAWKRRAAEFMETRPANEWEWLALAQHHGLPTRLLDWSYNPLVAAFFAASEEVSADGAIYCLLPYWSIIPEKAKPGTHANVARYKPHVFASRIARQSGLFTAHPKPESPLPGSLHKHDVFEVHTIGASYKRQLQFELNHYGINRLTLMGDLDGLSAHMRWTQENRNYWADHDEFMRELSDPIAKPSSRPAGTGR